VEVLRLVPLACDTGTHELTHHAAHAQHVEVGIEMMQCLLDTLVACAMRAGEHVLERRQAWSDEDVPTDEDQAIRHAPLCWNVIIIPTYWAKIKEGN
jgi:hypothetical protein